MSRTTDRAEFSQNVRVVLLESDLDQLTARVEEELEKFAKELHAVQRVLVGILISLATAAVLLAINIGVTGG